MNGNCSKGTCFNFAHSQCERPDRDRFSVMRTALVDVQLTPRELPGSNRIPHACAGGECIPHSPAGMK